MDRWSRRRRSLVVLGVLAFAIPQAAQRASTEPRALGSKRDASVSAGGGGPGTVVSELEISNTTGGLPDTLDDDDRFGTALAGLGDLDGDGIEDVAVAAPAFEWHADRSAVWVLFLDTDGSVRSYVEIRPSDDAFGDDVDVEDGFGFALANVGDLDSDGVPELAVGAPADDDGGSPGDQADRGAVWILFLRADGTLKSASKISALAGGFAGPLEPHVRFGTALAGLGDLDGDGTLELAVGAPRDRDGGGPGFAWRGAVWVLSLALDGSVAAQQKISATQGGFSGSLDPGDFFGSSLAALGDVDGDGTGDLAAGAQYDGDGAAQAGAVWVLFLEPDGSVQTQQKISATQGGFSGALGTNHFFGSALAAPGDLDEDGVHELAVGASGFVPGHGTSVWVLFLGADGAVVSHQRITSSQLGIGSTTAFGTALAALGDLDGDGSADLAAGDAWRGSSFHDVQGGVLTLFLEPAGTLRAAQPIDGDQPSFPATLDDEDYFGGAVADLGDLDGDGISEVAVGASNDDEVGFNTGAVYVLYPGADGSVRSYRKVFAGNGGFEVVAGHQDRLGAALETLGDLDGDGISELAVGAPTVAGEDARTGSVWVLFLAADGSVRKEQRISAGIGGFTGDIDGYDAFGASLAALGDLDGDGIGDLAAGAGGFYDEEGRFWILFLASDGTVKSQREITPADAGFAWTPYYFGGSLETLGDLDSDGIVELAVGSGEAEEWMTTLSILFLRADGSVRARTEIGAGTGGFGGVLDDYDFFAGGLAALGDLDGDGVEDVAVGASGDDDGAAPGFYSPGAVWVLFLRSDGTVRAWQKISALEGGFGGPLGASDLFGGALANLGDLDGDGLVELGAGAWGDDDGGQDRGALWRLGLDGVATVDFDRGDDQARSVLANGQALPGTAFTRTLAIAGAGANLGPALFDSTSDGPNALGADPDLLVGLGQILVLQDSASPTQSVPGFFDEPGDDPDGGLVTLGFRAPVQPLSLVLVDIDGSHGQGVKVGLSDVAGRTRVFEVPAGWTGDRLVDGTSGTRTLDLTTLAPQPGHASTALASQDRRFDARRVTTLRVLFATSGAIGALRWDPYPPHDGVRGRTSER